jgi:hypothetical protein
MTLSKLKKSSIHSTLKLKSKTFKPTKISRRKDTISKNNLEKYSKKASSNTKKILPILPSL